jgi:hypothetical protein
VASAFRYSATIGPRGTQVWVVGGNGWFTDSHFPQIDVRPIATPSNFPDANSPNLIYKDFAVRLSSVYPYLAAYKVTVVNTSNIDVAYQMRVWVP